jgi:hypothetical protein
MSEIFNTESAINAINDQNGLEADSPLKKKLWGPLEEDKI